MEITSNDPVDMTPESDTSTAPAPETAQENTTPAAPKTYTEDEVKMMLQKEGDRRVNPISQELKRFKTELEEVKKQSMTEAQRKQYDAEQERLKYESELNETQQKLAKYTTLAELNRRGWSEDMMEFCLSSDESEVASRAGKLQTLIDAEVAKVRAGAVKSAAIQPPAKGVSTTTVVEEVDYDDPVKFAAAVRAGRATLT